MSLQSNLAPPISRFDTNLNTWFVSQTKRRKSMNSIIEGVVIGGAGGAIAGITIWIVKLIEKKSVEEIHKQRVYHWLKDYTSEDGEVFKSTRAIASWCNLTEDRVRYICSIDKRVFLSTREEEDMWSLYEREARSIYEKRGGIRV